MTSATNYATDYASAGGRSEAGSSSSSSSVSRTVSTTALTRITRTTDKMSPTGATPAMDQLRSLVDSLSPRTAHQYRSYCKRYVGWLVERGLLESEPDELVHYHSLPLNNALVHWHLIETAQALPSLRKAISSLKFLSKLCAVNGGAGSFSETARAGEGGGAQTALDGKCLEQLIKLHELSAGHDNERGECGERGEGSALGDLATTLAQVSGHVWSTHSPLPEKYFRNGLERLRFLVDFQWRAYSRLSYEQRRQLRLADLHVTEKGVTFDIQTNSTSLILAGGGGGAMHQPVALLPQRNPLVCPLVSLAAYLFLRFRDGGFPRLQEAAGSWLEMPLIRGKSALDYPREETLGHYYSAVFRQCHVAYKRRDWFGRSALEFPRWRSAEFEFLSAHAAALQEAFPDHVASDYREALNLHPAAVTWEGLPEQLVVQLFPEVEEYRRQGGLSPAAERFLQLVDGLRRWLLRALPLLYRLFPEHDLFQSGPLNSQEFRAWLQLQELPLTSAELQALQVPSAADAGTQSAAPAGVAGAGLPAEETFRLVQHQTLSNFDVLLSLLSGIFDKLEMKKSSREYAVHQLARVRDTLRERIQRSRPDDHVKEESRAGSGSDLGDDDGDDDAELQQMVAELVGHQVEALEARLEARLAQMEARLEARMEARLSHVRENKRPAEPEAVESFSLDPALESIEDVVLEWFTPNPRMGGQCVHSMNKSGSAWRQGCEPLYRQRKAIVELYIHLVNKRGMDRFEAVAFCERLRGGGDLHELAETLREWKKSHGSFDGLGSHPDSPIE